MKSIVDDDIMSELINQTKRTKGDILSCCEAYSGAFGQSWNDYAHSWLGRCYSGNNKPPQVWENAGRLN